MKTVYKNGLCLSKRKTVDQLTQNGLSKRFIKDLSIVLNITYTSKIFVKHFKNQTHRSAALVIVNWRYSTNWGRKIWPRSDIEM